MGDESSTDHNKGARFITAAVAEPLRKLEGMLKQPWRGFKQQFDLGMTIAESQQQGKRARGKQCSCPSSCRCQTSWSIMEIGRERIREEVGDELHQNTYETKAVGSFFPGRNSVLFFTQFWFRLTHLTYGRCIFFLNIYIRSLSRA